MKIAVCGCSFSAKSELSPGTHWSELLEKKLDCKIFNYAVGGSSNNYIRLQMESALSISPDFIIVNSTTASRIDFPLDSSKNNIKKYNIFNFKTKTDRNAMSSFTLTGLAAGKWRYGSCPQDKKIAAEHFVMHLFDFAWKRQTDQWIITAGLKEFHDRNIKFLYDPWLLDLGVDQDNYSTDGMLDWFKEKYYINFENSFLSFFNNYKLAESEDPGYHLNDQAQNLIADWYANYIRDNILTAKTQSHNISYDR